MTFDPRKIRVNNPTIENVRDLLEFPVCLDAMYPPIHQCSNGHTICSICKPRIRNRCPTCKLLSACRGFPWFHIPAAIDNMSLQKARALEESLIRLDEELSLSGLGLTNVPSAVWETSEVEKVDLSKNSIEVLPSEMAVCSSLQTLVLSCNKLKEWPGNIFSSLPNLTCLKLDKNPLTREGTH